MGASSTPDPKARGGAAGTNTHVMVKAASERSLAITFVIALALFGIVAGLALAAYAGVAPRNLGVVNSQLVQQPGPTQPPNATPALTPTPQVSPAQYKASAKSVTITDIAANPNSYLGASVTFKGQVVGLLKNSTGAIAGVDLADPNNQSAIIQVNYTPFVTPASVKVGDTLTIWGQGTGSFISINGLGSSFSEGAVNEIYLHDATSGYEDNGVTDPAAYISGSG